MKDIGMSLTDLKIRAQSTLENVTQIGDATLLTGPAVELFRVSALIGALSLEVKGLKGRVNAFKTVKQEFGFKGNRSQVLEQLQKYRFANYPPRPMDLECPNCGKKALVPITERDGIDLSDGTRFVCHPLLDGCNHGFGLDQ